MSAKSDGQVVIDIVANDASLSESLKNANKETAALGTELKKVDKLLKLDPSNVQLAKQKQELLTKAVGETARKLDLLKEAQIEMQRQFDKGEITEDQFRYLEREIVATEQSLAKLSKEQAAFNSVVKDTEKKVEDLGDTVDDTKDEVEGLGNASDEMQKKMTAASATCAALCAGLIAIGVQAVQSSMEFESAFAKTQTIMDSNVMSAKQMRQEIMALSSLSGMSGANVSEAVYQAISGSVATEDATAFVEKANKLAVSGFTSLSNATDVLTTALNAYGLEAETVGGISNVLIQTQNLGKTSVDELAASMGRAISTGSAYGVNLENLSTAYVELTRGGIDTAEATTYLSSMLNELGDGGSKVGKILQEKTGKSLGQLMADGASLGDVLKILSDTVDGDAEALMGLWSSQEAGKASNAIMTRGIEDFNSVLSQMNQEMSGATGTTDKAYETMTHTSEFIDQKFRNSVNNLGIAFGDNLSPAVDWVKSSLTMVAETLTGWVQEYPAISAVAAGLTVGVGALGLALGAYTLKAKLATEKTKELTTAMLHNPFVLVTTGIVAAGAAIASWVAASDEAREAVAELTQAANTLNDTVRETEEAYNGTMDSIEGNVSLARQYAARLKELESQENLTAEQQEEYNSLLEKMKVVMPDINLELDEQTGMLLDGADALQKQIDGWYELAVAQALQDKFTAQIKAQADAEAELATNIAARKRKEAEKSVAEENQKRAEETAAEYLAQYNKESEAFERETANRAAGKATMSDDEYEALRVSKNASEANHQKYSQNATDFEIKAANIQGEITTLDNAIAKNEATIASNAAAVQNAEDAYRGYMEGLEEAEEKTESASGSFAEAADTWNSAASLLRDAYNESYASARESIEGQIGLFENMGTVTGASVTEMIKALDSQVAYLDQYSENMRIAAERGIDQGLLQRLNDGSKESAEILAGLVKATDEQIKEINEKFAKVGDGKEQFADAMTEYSGVIEDEKQAMVELAAQVGIDMSDALTEGLLNGYNAYLSAWRLYQKIGGHDSSSVVQHAYASGTYSADSGLALVGEAGPELMYLRGGERILTAEETRDVLNTVFPSAPQMAFFGAGAPAIAGRGAVQLHATIDVPLYVDGREFACATAEYMGEEMEFGGM